MYGHGCKTPGDGMTIGAVSVSDQVVWCFIPRESIGDLTGNPLRRGIVRYAQRYQPPSLVPEDDQYEKQLKTDCRHDQEVHRADACRMVVQKGVPAQNSGTPSKYSVFCTMAIPWSA